MDIEWAWKKNPIVSFAGTYLGADSSFSHCSGSQSCFYINNIMLDKCIIYGSIENFKRYNFSMDHIFWFCCFEKIEAVFRGSTTTDQLWVYPCYYHVPLGKGFSSMTFISQMKGLVELYSIPKYDIVWFCYWEMRAETLISDPYYIVKTQRKSGVFSIWSISSV